MACGYEPTGPDTITIEAWKPEGYKGDRPTICAGYTVKLPEVIEVTRARMHWSKGQLEAFHREEAPQVLLMGLEILEGTSNELQMALYTPRSRGGLADDR